MISNKQCNKIVDKSFIDKVNKFGIHIVAEICPKCFKLCIAAVRSFKYKIYYDIYFLIHPVFNIFIYFSKILIITMPSFINIYGWSALSETWKHENSSFPQFAPPPKKKRTKFEKNKVIWSSDKCYEKEIKIYYNGLVEDWNQILFTNGKKS